MSTLPVFKPVTKEIMTQIMPFLFLEKERTCDFSYGGILMWVDYFHYEYAIHNNTLLMRGDSPTRPGKKSYSFPLGSMSTHDAIDILLKICSNENDILEFSAVPEEAKNTLIEAGASHAEEQEAWGDYIYDAETLASLKGKKMSKKRNHVNHFISEYPDWQFEPLHTSHIKEIKEKTSREIAEEASNSAAAETERALALRYLTEFEEGNPNMIGGILKVNNEIIAYTIGDIKDDTLYIHIEKGERSINGSFEAINKFFAEYIISNYPQVKYINREDDAGDEGLRGAKMSYHPITILKKYRVIY